MGHTWVKWKKKPRKRSDYGESPKHFPKPDLHPKKDMITVWCFKGGIIHYNYLEKGKTITAESYNQESMKTHEKLSISYPALVNRRTSQLIQYGARPHIRKIVLKKRRELVYEVCPHASYWRDLALTDHHLFSHLERFLDNKIFDDEEEVKNGVNEFSNSKQPQYFFNGNDDLPQGWRKCVESDGNYFDYYVCLLQIKLSSKFF